MKFFIKLLYLTLINNYIIFNIYNSSDHNVKLFNEFPILSKISLGFNIIWDYKKFAPIEYYKPTKNIITIINGFKLTNYKEQIIITPYNNLLKDKDQWRDDSTLIEKLENKNNYENFAVTVNSLFINGGITLRLQNKNFFSDLSLYCYKGIQPIGEVGLITVLEKFSIEFSLGLTYLNNYFTFTDNYLYKINYINKEINNIITLNKLTNKTIVGLIFTLGFSFDILPPMYILKIYQIRLAISCIVDKHFRLIFILRPSIIPKYKGLRYNTRKHLQINL